MIAQRLKTASVTDLENELSRVQSEVDDAVIHIGRRMKVLSWMLLSAEDSTYEPPDRHAMGTVIDIATDLLNGWAAKLDTLNKSIRTPPAGAPAGGDAP